jgi:hypothetical protein
VPETLPVPVAHPLARWLRARVLLLRDATVRRSFPGAVELVAAGSPPGRAPVSLWTYGEEQSDHALRVDVLLRLLTDCAARGVTRVSLVHVRSGWHEPGDLDLGWAAASGTAGDISGVAVDSVLLVSRWGWCDLGSGEERSWARPRTRRRGGPA